MSGCIECRTDRAHLTTIWYINHTDAWHLMPFRAFATNKKYRGKSFKYFFSEFTVSTRVYPASIHEISVDFCFLDDIFREWDKRIKQEFGYAKYYGVFGLQNLSDRQFFIVVFIVISCIASAAFEFTK